MQYVKKFVENGSEYFVVKSWSAILFFVMHIFHELFEDPS